MTLCVTDRSFLILLETSLEENFKFYVKKDKHRMPNDRMVSLHPLVVLRREHGETTESHLV